MSYTNTLRKSMQSIPKHNSLTRVLMFSPFIVLLVIVVTVLILRSFSIPLQQHGNTIALIGLATVLSGVIIGLVSLLITSSIKIRWRMLLLVLYVPTVMFSLILSGF